MRQAVVTFHRLSSRPPPTRRVTNTITIDWPGVLQRIETGEDAHTEFKRGPGDLKPLGRAIAAFANTDGGLVVIGVDDDGTIRGVREDPGVLAERFASFLQSGLSTPVQAYVGRYQAEAGWVHWIDVPRQRGFEPLRIQGRVFVRRGRSSVEPAPSELQEWYNTFGYVVTEERAIEAAGTAAIDVVAFHAYLDRIGLDTTSEPHIRLEDDLRKRGVMTPIGDELRATLYGVLAFGRMPQSYPQTSNFWVECVAYAGTDRADEVLQVAEGKGRLDEQVRRAVGWFKGLGRSEKYVGIEREDRLIVPEKAVREALVNAVVHRDYAILGSKVLIEVFDDRVAITSPGTLPNTITPASVKAGGHPRSRNESLAHFMAAVGLMEQRGRGWPVIRRAMLQHNGSEPELYEDARARYVRVVLLRDR